jgi:hypothetical protein
MGLEQRLEMFSLKALLLGCLHYLHVCYFFDPLLPQGMDIETLRRTIATVCLLWMSVGYLRKRLHTPVYICVYKGSICLLSGVFGVL